MFQTRTIDEWMKLAHEWNDRCQTGDAETTRTLTAGAIHPVLAGISGALTKILSLRSPRTNGINAGVIFRLAWETDASFEKMRALIGNLLTEETIEAHDQAAALERDDVAQLIDITTGLIGAFKQVFPDVETINARSAIREGILSEPT